MNEIMEKTYELIDVLEQSDLIHDLEVYRDKILQNQELSQLIHKGNSSNDSYLVLDIKKKLYQYGEYREYMRCYQELMHLVMDMNHRYQKLLGKGCCYR